MATPVLQSKLEQLDSFVIKSGKDIYSTMLSCQLDEGTPAGDGHPVRHGLLAPPLIMQGDSIVLESNDAPIAAYSLFRIAELNEELGVRVFAKLEA